ncbi:hypothetical protein Drorol1_Dr00013566 [Drosera rotundifolia]
MSRRIWWRIDLTNSVSHFSCCVACHCIRLLFLTKSLIHPATLVVCAGDLHSCPPVTMIPRHVGTFHAVHFAREYGAVRCLWAGRQRMSQHSLQPCCPRAG